MQNLSLYYQNPSTIIMHPSQYQYLPYQQQMPSFYQQNQFVIQSQQGGSPYSWYYPNIQETLYFEQGDGEIFIYYDTQSYTNKMVTCIDISTLYKEKRGNAINIANFLCQIRHKNLIHIYHYHIMDDRLIFVEMEVPQNFKTWKTFCKQKFTPEETFQIFKQVTEGVAFLHQMNFIHRDIHPSRIQSFQGNVIKFNHIGLPYNFKKLLKRDNFSGHINYSAPELILEKPLFSSKVDVWALGCCLYYIIQKKDPFDGKDPCEIKKHILNLILEQGQQCQNIPLIFRPILEACFTLDENSRPDALNLLKLINQIEASQKQHNQVAITCNGQQIYTENLQDLQRLEFDQTNKSLIITDKKVQTNGKALEQKISQSNIEEDKLFNEQNLNINSSVFKTDSVKILNEKQDNQSPILNLNSQDTLPSDASADTMSSPNHSFLKDIQPTQSVKIVKKSKVYSDEDGIYEGHWENNQKNGEGKQIFSNGDVYIGSWKNGKMHGQGTLVFSSGDTYVGTFVNGLKNGHGILTFKTTGDSYEGDWKCDKMTGKGKYIYKSEEKVYEGDFVEGSPYGYGVMSCINFYYKGYFKSGLFEGQGKLEDFANNIIFEGHYYDGKRMGFGKLTDLITGNVFEGIWKDDLREGKGKQFTVKTNQVVIGIWKNDQLAQIQKCTVYDSSTNGFASNIGNQQ